MQTILHIRHPELRTWERYVETLDIDPTHIGSDTHCFIKVSDLKSMLEYLRKFSHATEPQYHVITLLEFLDEACFAHPNATVELPTLIAAGITYMKWKSDVSAQNVEWSHFRNVSELFNWAAYSKRHGHDVKLLDVAEQTKAPRDDARPDLIDNWNEISDLINKQVESRVGELAAQVTQSISSTVEGVVTIDADVTILTKSVLKLTYGVAVLIAIVLVLLFVNFYQYFN